MLYSLSMRCLVGCLGLLTCVACSQHSPRRFQPVNPDGQTVLERFVLPDSFVRVSTAEGSFQRFLQRLPVKTHGSRVRYYDGSIKHARNVYLAVIDFPIGNKDLLQCADAVIKLRAEYLFTGGRYDEIRFNFTNGFPCEYRRFRRGERVAIEGNHTWWEAAAEASNDRVTFDKYQELVFTYAGTISLEKELKSVPVQAMQIGDVLIQAGSPGHAVIVVDQARNPNNGRTLFLLAQSYMPAQEIQILINPLHGDSSPWYEIAQGQEVIETPEWTFKTSDLKRFQD